MHFILRNVMAFRPSSVVRTEASIDAPLLHGIRQNVFHALVAVKLDDLFHRAVLQVHPVKVFRMRISIPPAQAQFSRKLSRHFSISPRFIASFAEYG